MLIFDKFPSHMHAEEFARSVAAKWKRATSVHATQEESDAINGSRVYSPPPIVLVGMQMPETPVRQSRLGR